ncbi:hypothetical protein GDO86_007008, partial [Hymenochirus boettgeri]
YIMGCRSLCLALLLLIAGSYGQPQCTLITPSVLRVASEETIVVDAQGHNAPFDADILIQEFPLKKINLVTTKVSLNNNNNFLGTATVKIPADQLPNEPRKKQYVVVSVNSPSCKLEKVILVSYHSGYIFIQTDKTIYTPGSQVLYRLYSTDYKMKPTSKILVVEFVSPDGIIVKRDTILHDGKTGIIPLSHTLPELVNVGVWTISAKYEDTPQQNYTTNFEVKEYVLPTMEITLKPENNFFYFDASTFSVDILAQYLYGKHVSGYAFVFFGIQKDDVKKGIPESLQRVKLEDGECRAELKREHLDKYFKDNRNEMLEYSLYMTVSVITDTGSDMAEAQLEKIHIVTSPYKVLFTKTSKYFKPGMPFDIMVFVTNPDGSPAIRIPVVAQPGNVQGTTQADGTARLTVNTGANDAHVAITVKTNHLTLPAERQASSNMIATAYRPFRGQANYLHITIAGSEINNGQNIPVNFNIRNGDPGTQNQIQHFTYLIMSRGRILYSGRQQRQPGQPLVSMSLPITDQFIPSFRIVAYYMVNTPAGRDIVSDSLWVDVVDSCMGTLVVTGEKEKDNLVQSPSSQMKLKVRADYKANVGLVAVDKGVYVLNSKFKITQSKVWDSVEKSDIGCTPGCGADGPGVFYDAGLALQTSFNITTAHRSEPYCPAQAKRRKRSSLAVIEIKAGKSSQYKDKAKKCCLDGMRENLMGHSCERRSRLILDGKECVDAFLDCCKFYEQKKKAEKESKDTDNLGRSNEDDEYMLDADIFSRTAFPESWLWMVEQMLEKPDNNKLVRVELTYNSEFCSMSTAKKKFRQEVYVNGLSSTAVPFIIVPLNLGEHEIEVKVAVSGTFASDGVRKYLKVVPEGMRIAQTITTITLDRHGVQEEQIKAGCKKMLFPEKILTTSISLQGYSQELTFRKADNSYGVWIDEPSSTWLTAYVAKVFAMAQDFADIDSNVLCGAVKWLILQKTEAGWAGGITKEAAEPDATLTAFVVIAMLESQRTCNEQLNNLQNSIDKAVKFLTDHYPTLQKPYSIAITSYALALAGKLHNTKILMAASKDNRYWEVKDSQFISLEATSYALLALLKMKVYDPTNDIVRWINKQRYYGAVYGSTQVSNIFQCIDK